ncbi:hypothetical protein [Pseudobacillus wudalianchiensis]|uniref:Uncharacterized protein n=1 Tax=Pseudobacillus wudalianchiensis TaxID=1743143 RepID=A0A1B9B2R1_9BACI|nr:hypothetical protein [Bacillus wudalianchiensis]OCA90318.1 hypothetical protein A8F95_21245 [Bacillus wudalianchiensis]
MISYLISYLKGSAAAIIIASFSLMISSQIVFQDISYIYHDFYGMFVFASIFGYIYGILGLACLFLIRWKVYRGIKSYFVFFLLGGIGGTITEFIFEWDLIPFLMISTILGSLAFLASQKIKNKVISWIICVIPSLVIFVFPRFW